MRLELPKVELTQTACSFCVCVFQIEKLGKRDKRRYQIHLAIHHGLKPYYIEP
jgi:hypothetical protein